MPEELNPVRIPPVGPGNVGGTVANNPTTANSTTATVAGVTGTAFTAGLRIAGPTQASGLGVLGNGVTGVQGIGSGVGVQGTATEGTGVSGISTTGIGVVGQSSSTTVSAVHGVSSGFDAVVGESSSPAHAGTTGRNTATTPGPGSCGVYGVGGQYAGKFDGALQVNGNATVTGTLTVDVDIVLSNSDCAEEFEIGSVSEAEPGTVMVLDDSGALERSSKPYDKRVAGVISGAGPYRPGIVLGRGEGSPTRLPVALIGKVVCKVDAQYGPIEVGDLLTTSPTPGHAMNATDRTQAFGAVIGKALQRFSEGCGSVAILVALQ
jgi:hypothetical protein